MPPLVMWRLAPAAKCITYVLVCTIKFWRIIFFLYIELNRIRNLHLHIQREFEKEGVILQRKGKHLVRKIADFSNHTGFVPRNFGISPFNVRLKKLLEHQKDRCFLIQHNTQPNKNHAPGNQHVCNDSVPERGWWTPLASCLECGEHIHQSDFWEQMSCSSSENLIVVLITIAKGVKVTQVVAVNAVPPAPVEVAFRTLEELDEVQGIQQSEMVERRREMFFQKLDLSGLEGWSEENQAGACNLLAEYQDIFSLKPGELGCTDLANTQNQSCW